MALANLLPRAGFCPLNAKESDLVVLTVQSNNAAAIYPGVPVIAQTDGSVLRTPAGSAAGAATDGITAVVVEILGYKDTNVGFRRNAKYIPASTTWTNHNERSQVLAILANSNQRFAVKGDAAVASLAAARSLAWANCDHDYQTDDAGLGLSGIELDVASVNTTATLQWRVLDFLDVAQNDPTQVNFTAIVIPNLIYGLPVVGGATLGVT